MFYEFKSVDEETGDTVIVTKNDVEHISDFLEGVLHFTTATGYTYIKQIVAVYDDKREVSTM